MHTYKTLKLCFSRVFGRPQAEKPVFSNVEWELIPFRFVDLDEVFKRYAEGKDQGSSGETIVSKEMILLRIVNYDRSRVLIQVPLLLRKK